MGLDISDLSEAGEVSAQSLSELFRRSTVRMRRGCCSVEAKCPVRGNWDKVNVAIRVALEAITLADMAPKNARHNFLEMAD